MILGTGSAKLLYGSRKSASSLAASNPVLLGPTGSHVLGTVSRVGGVGLKVVEPKGGGADISSRGGL